MRGKYAYFVSKTSNQASNVFDVTDTVFCVLASHGIPRVASACQVEERCMKRMDDRPNPVDLLLFMAGCNIT
jgi:hypothetical protein